jgi:hypothetical protein
MAIQASVLSSPMGEFDDAVRRLRLAVPPGSSVMGSQTYWFGLPAERYLSWEQIIYFQRYAPGSTVEDALRALKPDYFVLDRHLENFIAPDIASAISEYNSFLWLPQAEIEQFLEQRSSLVTAFDTNYFGQIRVYKIDWRADVGQASGSQVGT